MTREKIKSWIKRKLTWKMTREKIIEVEKLWNNTGKDWKIYFGKILENRGKKVKILFETNSVKNDTMKKV